MFISVESGAGGLGRGSDLGMCREVKRGLSGRKSGFNPANRNSDDSGRFLRFFCRFVFTALVKSINRLWEVNQQRNVTDSLVLGKYDNKRSNRCFGSHLFLPQASRAIAGVAWPDNFAEMRIQT